MTGNCLADRREFLLYYAGVCEREAESRRDRHPEFAEFLAEGAAKTRREADAIDARPPQGDLFAIDEDGNG